MYHLRLKKALSYRGVVSATRENPDVLVEDRAAADAAIASGYFLLVDGAPTEPEPESEPGKTLDEMTVAELETFATYHGISLKGIRGKDNMIAKLKEELGAEETENEVDYGSPIMVGLQE